MTTTLPLFWHLSSASKKERIDASVKLVSALERFQAQFTPKLSQAPVSDEEDEDGVKSDGLDALNAHDVSYSIRRLVRGLASPRESSRLGFAVALTELLSRIDTVTCSQIVDLIIDSSKTQGSMSGQEERDVYFARLFGLTAVIQSGLLVRSKPLATSASNATAASDASSYHETISQLIALGEKKSWLRESTWWTMGLAIDALRESNVCWKEDVVDPLIQTIFLENKNWSPEKVAMALKLQNLYTNHDWQKLFSPSFKNADLLSTGNLQYLARILKESTSEDEEAQSPSKSAASAWKPQVHFVWDIILEQLLPSPDSVSSKGSFQEFFRIVVDESLFSSTSSAERKYWGFQIFQKALTRVTADNMPMLFTRNFMRSWINHLSQSDRYLHKVALQVATEIQVLVQKHPALGFTLLLQLTGVNGSHQFDRLTKTKTVECILASMDTDGIKKYIDYLLRQVNEDKKTDVQSVNTKRAWITEQLAALIRNGAIPKSDEWIQSILDWFVLNGLFLMKKRSDKSYRALQSMPNPAFSDELQQICRTRLLSCLADLTGQMTLVKSDDVKKLLKVPGVASDGEFWVSKVLTTIEQLEKDTKHVVLLAEVEEEHQALRINARQLLEKLKKVTGDQQEAAKGAELLLVATLVQQHCADEQETDTEVLAACIEGTSRMLLSEGKKGKKGKKSRQSPELTAEHVPKAVDILVDTVIGFLEKSTSYMRTVGNQAFALLSGSVQETTIDLILTQLERRDPADPMDDEGEDEGENEDENDGEDKVLAEDDEEDSDDQVESSAEEDSEEEDLELRQKIEEVLRVSGIEADTGDSDDDSDRETMDDDQMMAFDEQLAEVFRSRTNEKRSRKDVDAQREATHFKNRVLDIVDIFIKKQPSNPHIFRFILPLVELVVGTGMDERQLSDKAKGLLRSRIGNLKQVPSIVDTERVGQVLTDLHSRARKTRTADILTTLSQCSLYLSKLLLQSQSDTHVVRVYRESLADFLTRKNSALNAGFFQDFIRRSPSTAWCLRDDLIKLSSKAVNVYRRCQAFQLLQVLIGQLSNIGDPQEEILTFMLSLRLSLFELMSNACDDTVVATTPQMKELFKLGLVAIRQTKRIVSTPEKLPTIWQPATWDALRGKLATSDRFKASAALQTMCQQMVHTSHVSASPTKSKSTRKGDTVEAPKRKAEEASVDVAVSTETKRKKVKEV